MIAPADTQRSLWLARAALLLTLLVLLPTPGAAATVRGIRGDL